ncbi:MAG: hypothetical protein R3C62_06150 [Chloroflexota bacterium]
MLIKRLALMAISFAVGFVLTLVITFAIGTTLEEYGGIYTFFTALSLACAVGIWLDKFMGTELLPK